MKKWLVILASLLSPVVAKADEGMWLLNAPINGIKENYGFSPDAAWMEHVQRSAVRFNSGGSASFVSADGLIITNHHVASSSLYKVSTPEHNYLRDGFHAKTREEEIKCADLEINVLVSIEDVTDRVKSAMAGKSEAEASAAKRAILAEIEKESLSKTGLRSDVITLYQGGRYHLYRYKKYTDVRIVFAPPQQIAFFGGDPDNFEYPRYNLDVTFFRAYEDGKPAKVEHYLKWSKEGVAEGDLVFVCGNPGSTSRQLTVEETQYLRDFRVPLMLSYLKNQEVMLLSFGARSQENYRIAHDRLFSVQNSRKVYDGRIAGLLDPAFWEKKRASQAALIEFAKAHPELGDIEGAFKQIADIQTQLRSFSARYSVAESYSLGSDLYRIARNLVRHAAEKSKPNGDRLREFRDSNKASLEQELFSPKPIYEDLERLSIANMLAFGSTVIGADDPVMKTLLGGKAPSVRAADLVAGTKVKDVEFRKKVYEMSSDEIAALNDTAIQLAIAMDPEARALRKLAEEKRDLAEQAHAKIAAAQFAKDGTKVYPDATFTLRLSFGKVAGYDENGKKVPAFTDYAGLYQRAESQGYKEPFDLPKTWLDAKGKLDLTKPFNFVSTADIIGGNSGSPTINQKGEFVGIIFDGNIYSLVGDYGYSDVQSRALSVDARGIVEALHSVHDAQNVLEELLR